MNWERRVAELKERHDALTSLLTDASVLSSPSRLREVAREHRELNTVVETADELARVRSGLAQARELLESDDAELSELARTEVEILSARAEVLQETLRQQLLPRDPLADRAAVVEIRAGTGGDEAGLFASDLLRMYTRYAERRDWSVELLHVSDGEKGGIREAVMVVRGKDAYGDLRNESGVHRVQRVPETESQGRIHTSAATVAVLPEAAEVDVAIRDDEIRVDVYRSSGPGGQSVNTTDSAVRITHLPTGLVVTCQDEKSQHKNKAKALQVLRSRLLDQKIAQQEAERARERKMQVGTGDRSAKIRTYNFPDSRVTDHRIGLSIYRLQSILNGDLEEVVQALRMARETERLESPAAD